MIDRLDREAVAVLGKPEMRSRMRGLGLEAVSSTPAEPARAVTADRGKSGGGVRPRTELD